MFVSLAAARPFDVFRRLLPAAALVAIAALAAQTVVGQSPDADSADQNPIILPDQIDESGVAVESSTAADRAADRAAGESEADALAAIRPEIQRLFQQLSSPLHARREAATAALVAMGPEVIEPLRRLTAASADPEANARAILVVDRVQQADLPQRIRILMRQPDRVEDHRFYGWPPFANAIGRNRGARLIFVELIKSYPQLAEQSLDDAAEFNAVRDRIFRSISERRQQGSDISVADAIAAQYLVIRDAKSPADHKALTVQIVSTYPYSMRLNDPQLSPMLKELTNRWLATAEIETIRPMLISLDFGLSSGRELALRLLREGTDDDDLYTHAMLLLARFGEPTDLDLIEPYLRDEKVVFRTNVILSESVMELTQQRRDLALMASLRIRGLEVGEYFPEAQPHPTRVYLPQTIAFPAEAAGDSAAGREAAFRRYQEAVSGT